MKKKLISIVAILMIVICLCVPVFAGPSDGGSNPPLPPCPITGGRSLIITNPTRTRR